MTAALIGVTDGRRVRNEVAGLTRLFGIHHILIGRGFRKVRTTLYKKSYAENSFINIFHTEYPANQLPNKNTNAGGLERDEGTGE